MNPFNIEVEDKTHITSKTNYFDFEPGLPKSAREESRQAWRGHRPGSRRNIQKASGKKLPRNAQPAGMAVRLCFTADSLLSFWPLNVNNTVVFDPAPTPRT